MTTLSWSSTDARAADALAATAEGTLLGAYAFTDYKKAGGRKPVHRVDLATEATEAGDDAEAVLRRAMAVATAVTTARDLVNTPPNDLYPASFAARAAALGEAALEEAVAGGRAATLEEMIEYALDTPDTA